MALTRRKVVAAVAATALLGVVGGAAAVGWLADEPAQPTDRVSTRDGVLSFRMPTGWHRLDCPSGADGCLLVVPDPSNRDDYVSAMIGPPDAAEGELAGFLQLLEAEEFVPESDTFQRLTIGGIPALRIDDEQSRSVIVTGQADEGGFIVLCGYRRQEQAVRTGCDTVTGSLIVGGRPIARASGTTGSAPSPLPAQPVIERAAAALSGSDVSFALEVTVTGWNDWRTRGRGQTTGADGQALLVDFPGMQVVPHWLYDGGNLQLVLIDQTLYISAKTLSAEAAQRLESAGKRWERANLANPEAQTLGLFTAVHQARQYTPQRQLRCCSPREV